MTEHSRNQDSKAGEPWQLAIFRKGLKKRLRFRALKELLKPIAPDERCLLLTRGHNNRAMNHFSPRTERQIVLGRSRRSLDWGCPNFTGFHNQL
jgi:hypothetical protein